MAEQNIDCVAGTYRQSLGYSINPGGSQDAVRLASVANSYSDQAVSVNLYDASASKWPYYRWYCSRAIVYFDLSSYSSPGIILSAKIRFKTTYIGQYYGDMANELMYALDDEGVAPNPGDLTVNHYGSMLGCNTILGVAYGTEYSTFSGHEWYCYLNSAGIAHLNWGSMTSFVFRCNKDVYNIASQDYEGMFRVNGSYYGDRPRLILTLIDAPYLAFRGMFIRGNEIQAVFSSPADNVSRIYRSPDFGTTWYPISGCNDVGTVDIGFDTNDTQKTFVGGEGKLNKFDHADGEVYNMVEGATVVGTTTEIDVDKDSEIALIGTTSKLYKTTHWGDNAY